MVTDLNNFNGDAQTTNLGVRSSSANPRDRPNQSIEALELVIGDLGCKAMTRAFAASAFCERRDASEDKIMAGRSG
jgi:hypothetical protein